MTIASGATILAADILALPVNGGTVASGTLTVTNGFSSTAIPTAGPLMVARPGWTAGALTLFDASAGTLDSASVGIGLTLAAGTLSATGLVPNASLGALNNAGTIQVHNAVTLSGTAGGTLSIALGNGTDVAVVTMPASGGTVTLGASPAYTQQPARVDVKQGATAGAVVLNSGFVFGKSGGPTGYTATATAAAIDSLFVVSPDGTHFRVYSIVQGFTL